MGGGMFNAWSLLREAVRQNPRLGVALGVAALGAVTSIVMYFSGGDRELAVIGGVFVVGFMFILSIYTSITAPDGTTNRPILANLLLYGVSLIFIMTLAAVFMSYFFCWPQPFGRVCVAPYKHVSIVDVDFLSEHGAIRRAEGSDVYWTIPSIKRRSSRDFHIAKMDDGVFFVAIIVRGFLERADGSTTVNADVIVETDAMGVVDTKKTGTYPSIKSWEKRKIPSEIGPNLVKTQFMQAAFDYREGDIPIVVALSCMREAGRPAGKINITITVFDEFSGTYARQSIDGSIIRDGVNSAGAQSCLNPS